MGPSASSGSDLPTGLAGPARRALSAAGITRLEQLAGFSELELLKLHGTGSKVLRTLGEALSARGLIFASEEDSGRISDQANGRISRKPANTGS